MLTFVCTCLLFIIIGAAGPGVFNTVNSAQSGALVINTGNDSSTLTDVATWKGHINNMSKSKQMMWFQIKIGRPDSVPDDSSLTYTQNLAVRVSGSSVSFDEPNRSYMKAVDYVICKTRDVVRRVTFKRKDPYSDWQTVYTLHILKHRYYDVEIDFWNTEEVSFRGPSGAVIDPANNSTLSGMKVYVSMTYIDPRYTSFEVGWKYTLVVITILVMLNPRMKNLPKMNRCGKAFAFIFEGWFPKLCGFKLSMWSYQQRWISLLLPSLFLFNDPLIAAYINATDTSNAEFLGGLAIVFQQTFVALLLIFWLCILDDTSELPAGQATITLSEGVGWTTSRLPQRFRKHAFKYIYAFIFWWFTVVTYIYYRYQQRVDPTYDAQGKEGQRYNAATGFLILLAVIYILWFLYYMCRGFRTIASLPPAFIMVFLLTAISALATVAGILAGSYYPLAGGVSFLGVCGLMNMYVWTLAFVYAPLEAAGGASGNDFSEFEVAEDANNKRKGLSKRDYDRRRDDDDDEL